MDAAAIDQLARDLQTLLEQLDLEFELLREQQMDRFDALQHEKEALLARIAAADLHAMEPGNAATPLSFTAQPAWHRIMELGEACREHQKRNEILINRKLIVVRSALQALRVPGGEEQQFYGPRGKLSGQN